MAARIVKRVECAHLKKVSCLSAKAISKMRFLRFAWKPENTFHACPCVQSFSGHLLNTCLCGHYFSIHSRIVVINLFKKCSYLAMPRQNRGDAHSFSDVPGHLCGNCNKSGGSQLIQCDLFDLWYHYNCSGTPVDLLPQEVKVKLLLLKCNICLQKNFIVLSSSTIQEFMKDPLSGFLRLLIEWSKKVLPILNLFLIRVVQLLLPRLVYLLYLYLLKLIIIGHLS